MLKSMVRWLLVVAVAGGVFWLLKQTAMAPTQQSPEELLSKIELAADRLPERQIKVASPKPNQTVLSPLTITGQARGSWYFEASFPVQLVDEEGTTLVSAPAQAQSDWMTDDWVPFSVTLTFDQPQTAAGQLILKKDNPSGQAENEARITVPVKFK